MHGLSGESLLDGNSQKKPFSLLEEHTWLNYAESLQGNDVTNARNPFWSYGENELVGHGEQTSPDCGTFNKFMGCLNYEKHNQTRFLDERIEKNSVFVKPIYHSCDKPTCPSLFQVWLGCPRSISNGRTLTSCFKPLWASS